MIQLSIKCNLAKRYSDIGATVNIPYFGRYIANFISKTKFAVTQPLITYPETVINADNILSLSKTTYTNTGIAYCLAAKLAGGTAALKIKITSLSADTIIILPRDTTKYRKIVNQKIWHYWPSTSINWTSADFNNINYTQIFTAIESGKSCDLMMAFDKGSFLIEYFEMNAMIPTRRKTIICN